MSDIAVAGSIDEFSAAVRRDLDPKQVTASDLHAFAIDGVEPDVAVEPETVEQLRRVLTEAHEANLTVVPFGGGTHMSLGNVPESYDVALSMRRLDRNVEYEPAGRFSRRSLRTSISWSSVRRGTPSKHDRAPV